jgi:hypothetical protein
MTKSTWAMFYEAGGVEAFEWLDAHHDSHFCVSDKHSKHYRISFYACRSGEVSVGVAAASGLANDDRMSNYTHDLPLYCGPEETGDVLEISDEGRLTVMVRARSTAINMSTGIVLQLPKEYVQAIRLTIDKCRQLAKARAEATKCDTIKPATMPTGLTQDEYAAAEWRRSCPFESDSWIAAAGSMGLVVDAWRAWKASGHQAPHGWDQVEA